MVISYCTCQKEEKECTWVKYLIYAVFARSQIYCNLQIFLPNLYSQMFKKKMFFSKSGARTVDSGARTVDSGARTTNLPEVWNKQSPCLHFAPQENPCRPLGTKPSTCGLQGSFVAQWREVEQMIRTGDGHGPARETRSCYVFTGVSRRLLGRGPYMTK